MAFWTGVRVFSLLQSESKWMAQIAGVKAERDGLLDFLSQKEEEVCGLQELLRQTKLQLASAQACMAPGCQPWRRLRGAAGCHCDEEPLGRVCGASQSQEGAKPDFPPEQPWAGVEKGWPYA